jgi:hypothetical protein
MAARTTCGRLKQFGVNQRAMGQFWARDEMVRVVLRNLSTRRPPARTNARSLSRGRVEKPTHQSQLPGESVSIGNCLHSALLNEKAAC